MIEKQKRYKYDKALLDKCMARDGASLVGEYEKLTRETKIEFMCKCGVITLKNFRVINIKGGAYCIDCQKKTKTEKTTITNLKKFGVKSPLQNNDILNKVKNTIRKKYGVDNISSIGFVKQKKEEKTLKSLGVKNPSKSEKVKEKKKITCENNYGVSIPFKSDLIKNKAKETCLERYGVENPTQDPVIFEKAQTNSKRFKKYKMPSGDIRYVQGFEPFALDYLCKNYLEDHIKTKRKDIPSIKYEIDKKNKVYHPDIYIPHENKIIEVKSCWTIKIHPEIIKAKAEACKSQGYNYEIWCYDRKGNRVDLD